MKVFVIFLALVGFVGFTIPSSYGLCISGTDWDDVPCWGRICYNSDEPACTDPNWWKERWEPYYDYKGKDWMESKKQELLDAIKSDSLIEWKKLTPNGTNSNVHDYYYYMGEVPNHYGVYVKQVFSGPVPPLKQIRQGTTIEDVYCKQNLVLIQKYDGIPACVTESTKQKLIERGWTTKNSFHNTIPIKTDNVSLENNFPNIKERNIILQIGQIQDNNGALSVSVLENTTVQESTDNIMFQKVGYSAMRTISKNNDYFLITSGNDIIQFKTLQEPTLQTIFTGKDKHQTTIYFPIQIQLEQDLKENESLLFNYSLPYIAPDHDKTYSLSITSLQPLTIEIPTNAIILENNTRVDSIFWLYEKDKGNTLSYETKEYSLYYGTTNPPIMIDDIVVYAVKFQIDKKFPQ